MEKFLRKLVKACLGLVFRCLHRDLPEKTVDAFLQFVKFGIVGLSNTLVNYVIYIGVLFSLQAADLLPDADYIAANCAAFVLSVLWSFYWNNKYVFSDEDNREKTAKSTEGSSESLTEISGGEVSGVEAGSESLEEASDRKASSEKTTDCSTTGALLKKLLKTYLSYAFTGLILQNVLSYLWVAVVHISKTVAPLINLVVTVPLNFILNKYWAFRSGKGDGAVDKKQ